MSTAAVRCYARGCPHPAAVEYAAPQGNVEVCAGHAPGLVRLWADLSRSRWPDRRILAWLDLFAGQVDLPAPPHDHGRDDDGREPEGGVDVRTR